jgi:fumarate reductase flavoprotein subunit
MSHLGPDKVRQLFPGMVKRCADSGFDLAAGKVEVVPTAHYFMGGVVVDVDTKTRMPGLYVAGEDAGGAHGSNRLGGNGVANSTVYGGVAGDVMGRDALAMGALRDPDEGILQDEIDRACRPFAHAVGDLNMLRQQLRQTMWDDVGVMRDAAGIKTGLEKLSQLKEQLYDIGVEDGVRAFNLTWHDWLNMDNLMEISQVIAHAALARENSRGAHFREDFPNEGSLDQSYFTLAKQTGDRLEVTREDVDFSIVRPGETILPADAPETLVS